MHELTCQILKSMFTESLHRTSRNSQQQLKIKGFLRILLFFKITEVWRMKTLQPKPCQSHFSNEPRRGPFWHMRVGLPGEANRESGVRASPSCFHITRASHRLAELQGTSDVTIHPYIWQTRDWGANKAGPAVCRQAGRGSGLPQREGYACRQWAPRVSFSSQICVNVNGSTIHTTSVETYSETPNFKHESFSSWHHYYCLVTLLSFIPAKCWMAPDIPTAI